MYQSTHFCFLLLLGSSSIREAQTTTEKVRTPLSGSLSHHARLGPLGRFGRFNQPAGQCNERPNGGMPTTATTTTFLHFTTYLSLSFPVLSSSSSSPALTCPSCRRLCHLAHTSPTSPVDLDIAPPLVGLLLREPAFHFIGPLYIRLDCPRQTYKGLWGRHFMSAFLYLSSLMASYQKASFA